MRAKCVTNDRAQATVQVFATRGRNGDHHPPVRRVRRRLYRRSEPRERSHDRRLGQPLRYDRSRRRRRWRPPGLWRRLQTDAEHRRHMDGEHSPSLHRWKRRRVSLGQSRCGRLHRERLRYHAQWRPDRHLPRWMWGCLRDQTRSEEHTSELQSRQYLVCRLLLEKKKNIFAPVTPLWTTAPARPPFAAITTP